MAKLHYVGESLYIERFARISSDYGCANKASFDKKASETIPNNAYLKFVQNVYSYTILGG